MPIQLVTYIIIKEYINNCKMFRPGVTVVPLLEGLGAGADLGVGEGVGAGEEFGAGVGVGVELGAGVGVGEELGVGAGEGLGVGADVAGVVTSSPKYTPLPEDPTYTRPKVDLSAAMMVPTDKKRRHRKNREKMKKISTKVLGS